VLERKRGSLYEKGKEAYLSEEKELIRRTFPIFYLAGGREREDSCQRRRGAP